MTLVQGQHGQAVFAVYQYTVFLSYRLYFTTFLDDAYDQLLAKPIATDMVRLRISGATAYCNAMTIAMPSFAPDPESSTITITLFAVGVKNTITV